MINNRLIGRLEGCPFSREAGLQSYTIITAQQGQYTLYMRIKPLTFIRLTSFYPVHFVMLLFSFLFVLPSYLSDWL